MSWSLIASFSLPWAIGAILGLIYALAVSFTGGSPAAFQSVTNDSLSPSSIHINEPTIGADDALTGANVSIASNPITYLGYLVDAAALNYDFFTGRLQLVRWFILALTAPLAYMAGRELFRDGAQFLGGLGRIFVPFLRGGG